MIKLEVEHIVQILTKTDKDIESAFGDDVGQWVQFLIRNVKNDKYLICGSVDEKNNLSSHVVGVHQKKDTALIYISDNLIDDTETKQMLFLWAKNNNSQKIYFKDSNGKTESWVVV